MSTEFKQIKTMVRGAYDMQKLRIQKGNRVAGNFKAKLGQAPSKPEHTLDAAGKKVLDDLRTRYKKITDGIMELTKNRTNIPKPAKFVGDEVISTYTEFCLVHSYFEMERMEKQQFSMLEAVLETFPIYTQFLAGVKGIGPAMAGVILSEFDIYKAEYPSSLCKYAGLSVEWDNRGTSKRAEHLVDKEYTTKDGKKDIKKSITFNPFLKTKLVGVLGGGLLRNGNERYTRMYYEYQNRLQNNPVHVTWARSSGAGILPPLICEVWEQKDTKVISYAKPPKDERTPKAKGGKGELWKELDNPPGVTLAEDKKSFTHEGATYVYGKSKGHRHNMAVRFMIKRFLHDLYNAWRPLEGLSVAPEYSEAKLGLKHNQGAASALPPVDLPDEEDENDETSAGCAAGA